MTMQQAAASAASERFRSRIYLPQSPHQRPRSHLTDPRSPIPHSIRKLQLNLFGQFRSDTTAIVWLSCSRSSYLFRWSVGTQSI